jgi:hypothetical protein
VSDIDRYWFNIFQANPWIEKVVIILCVYAWIAMLCVAFARRKA